MSESSKKTLSSIFEGLTLDANAIKIVLLTAGVVVAVLSVPLIFIFKNFVTFEALDAYFKVTDSVRPKILHTVAEELDSGYSKNFIFDSSRSTDSTMLFYALPNQKVTLSASAHALGSFPRLQLQLNNCVIAKKDDAFHIQQDVSRYFADCPPDEPNLHTLKVVIENALPRDTTLRITSLVLVKSRIRGGLEGNGAK